MIKAFLLTRQSFDTQNGMQLVFWFHSEAGLTPPTCEQATLDLNLSYAEGTLNMDFDLGTTQPANWNVWLSFQNDMILLWSAPLSVIDPPIFFPISIPGFPQIGKIGFVTNLTTQEGVICIDSERVDTGPMLPVSTGALEDLIR